MKTQAFRPVKFDGLQNACIEEVELRYSPKTFFEVKLEVELQNSGTKNVLEVMSSRGRQKLF